MIPKSSIPKLQKMLLLLSSDQEHEALAAVRAIGRTLEGEGATWHDLAALMAPRASKGKVNGSHYTGPRNPPWEEPPKPKQQARTEQKPEPEFDYSIADDKIFKTMMTWTLTDWEREFVHSVYEQWKRNRRVTKKQKAILDRIQNERNKHHD